MEFLAPVATRYATRGMVCSVDHLASSAGVAMLRRGGTAVDAAIAANAVLTVTTQHMCGLGGDLYALVHEPGQAAPAVLNASGRSGSGADADRLRAMGHGRVPFTGHISAVTVPGCVDGWIALHARLARLDLAELLEPARRYAEDGFPVSPTLAVAARRLEALTVPGARDFPRRPALEPGARMRRPGVARTLAAIATGGRSAFYEGEFGEALVAMGAGEFSSDDLSSPHADWVEGLHLEVWGRRIWTVPPNSQGYLTLAGAWVAAGLAVPEDPDDPLWAHLLIEAARQVAHDRPAVLHEGADGRALLAEERLAPRRAAVAADRASRAGGSYQPGGTVYLCAADASGMGVSLIQSNYAGFGSMLGVPGLGIFLHNRGAGFSLEPGHPAEYGPRRRPPHTLAPALVTFPDGSLDCLVGTMGGDSQPQLLLQLLARRYLARQDPAGSLAAARWVLAGDAVGFDVWGRGGEVRVAIEEHAPAAWFDGLARRGHRVMPGPSWGGEFGHAHLIALEGGTLAGAADPRSLGGAAAGF